MNITGSKRIPRNLPHEELYCSFQKMSREQNLQYLFWDSRDTSLIAVRNIKSRDSSIFFIIHTCNKKKPQLQLLYDICRPGNTTSFRVSQSQRVCIPATETYLHTCHKRMKPIILFIVMSGKLVR